MQYVRYFFVVCNSALFLAIRPLDNVTFWSLGVSSLIVFRTRGEQIQGAGSYFVYWPIIFVGSSVCCLRCVILLAQNFRGRFQIAGKLEHPFMIPALVYRQATEPLRRPKNGWCNCECKIPNWKERSKDTADWQKSIKETKVCFGL